MITTVHARGAVRDAVVAVVTKQLEAEGYVVDPTAEEPRHLSLGAPAVRKIDIVEGGGWVSLVDHPYADTKWAKLLSSELALPVVELAGECDHVFFSTSILFEGGAERGASRVPEDAVLGDDGRHRIRPGFLAAVAPDARATLEAGVVVHDLGGEENIVKVGELLGIPRPLVRPDWDQEPELRLTFRRTRDVAVSPEQGGGLAALLAELTAGFGDEERAQLEALLDVPAAVEPKLFVQVSQRGASVGAEDGALEVRVSLGSTMSEARGITIELAGAGLALLEPAMKASIWFGGESIELTGERDGAVARYRTDVVLTGTPRALPGGFVMNLAVVPGNDHAEATFRIPSALPRAGRGEIAVTVRSGDLVCEESLELAVAGKRRTPLLPPGASITAGMLEAYAARGRLNGWIGFGAPWSDVTARVTPMLQDLVAALREALPFALDEVRVLTSTFESLTFATRLETRDATWQKIEAELMRGGALHLNAMTEGFTMGDEPRPMLFLELTHNRDGGLSGGPAKNIDGEPIDRPRVTLSWNVTPPATAAGRAILAEISRRILLDAGHVAGQLGGYVSSNERTYEHLAGTDRLNDTQTWLADHVRMPAWCILAPSAAATKLAPPRSERVRTTRTTHGLFAWSTAADPFAYDEADAEAMERFVLPAVR